MKTYISILRGINVSGKNIIKMDDLRKLFEGLGFKNVRTYIQSGNVLFEHKTAANMDLEKRIEKKIEQHFKLKVPVLVRDKEELANVLLNNPFVKRKEDVSKLHVTFFSEEPKQEHIDKIKNLSFGKDEFILKGNVIYLFCPDGYGNTKLSNNFFENKLKVSATTRNWNTLNQLNLLAG